MLLIRWIVGLVLAAVVGCVAQPACAVTITLDYRYDDDLINGNQFFSTSNPQGASGAATARAAMQAAADYYSGILTDTLLPIESPRYEAANGTVLWRWTARFTNPSTGFGLELANDPPPAEPPLPIAANEYVIFVGARPLANNAVGTASPGVVKKVQWFLNGSLTAAEKNIRDTINDQFIARAERRGETSGFVSWGGSVAFDSDASNQWHFDHLSSPSGNEVDLYSVAIHEIGHALGFGNFSTDGSPTEWSQLLSGNNFVGSTAVNSFGGAVPLESSDRSHWKDGTQSKVYGGTANQIAAMTDAIVLGTRKRLTDLDAAALTDLGWELTLPPLPPTVPGDYNGNGIVDAADYSVWRDSLGQTGTNLAANGNNSGASANRVDQADYTFWAARFGNTTPSGAAALGPNSAVPEPTAVVLMLVGGLALLTAGRRGSRRA